MVCELSEPKKTAKYTPPQFCTRDVDRRFSSGASGGCLHGGASFKVGKAHFAARKRARRTAKMK